MRVTYLHHSGFVIECENDISIIFDFYEDPCHKLPPILKMSRLVYVLVSHSHPDHFNSDIFDWQNTYPHSKFIYIISNELRKKLKRNKKFLIPQNCNSLYRGETFIDEHIKISAFGSTDIGVSYLIAIDGVNLFHAGDLNNWHWSNESTEQEIKTAEGNFLAILREIKNTAPKLFLAMFPVDPRMGKDFFRGAHQFVSTVDVKNFIPMHQWGNFTGSCNFNLYRVKNGKYHCLHDGECVEL